MIAGVTFLKGEIWGSEKSDRLSKMIPLPSDISEI